MCGGCDDDASRPPAWYASDSVVSALSGKRTGEVKRLCTTTGWKSLIDAHRTTVALNNNSQSLADWMASEGHLLAALDSVDFQAMTPTNCAIVYGHNCISGRTLVFKNTRNAWLLDGYYLEPDIDCRTLR